MEKILRVNDQKSGNALLIDTCNDFRKMNCPTIQPISLDEQGKMKYRSQGGLIGIYTEKVLDEVIEELEALRLHVKKYESSQKQEAKQVLKVSKKVSKKKEEEETDEKTMKKALKTLMSVGHTKEEAKKILKIDEDEDEGGDLPDDIKVTLQVLLDRGTPKQEAYKKLGLTKAGKVDRRKKR